MFIAAFGGLMTERRRMTFILFFDTIGSNSWQTLAVTVIVFTSPPGDIEIMPASVYSIPNTVPRVLSSGVSLLDQLSSFFSVWFRYTKYEAMAGSTAKRCKTKSVCCAERVEY